MYNLLVGIINICIFSVLFFIIYVMLAGISMLETSEKEALNKLASNTYLYTMALMIILSITNSLTIVIKDLI
jgi:hypothetical protein